MNIRNKKLLLHTMEALQELEKISQTITGGLEYKWSYTSMEKGREYPDSLFRAQYNFNILSKRKNN